MAVAAGIGDLGLETMKFLVAEGASVNETDQAGGTALMLSAYVGSLGNVKWLVEQGADLR